MNGSVDIKIAVKNSQNQNWGEKEFQIYRKRERLEIKIGGIKRREMQGCEKCKEIAKIQIARIWIARKRIKSQKDERNKMKCRQITELINRVNLTMPVKCKSHLDMAERAQFIRV